MIALLLAIPLGSTMVAVFLLHRRVHEIEIEKLFRERGLI